MECELSKMIDSMLPASRVLSWVMTLEALVSESASCRAEVSVFASAGASVSSNKWSSGICRTYSRPRLDASMRSLTEK